MQTGLRDKGEPLTLKANKGCRGRGGQGLTGSAACAQNPIQAIVQHAEHGQLYAADPLMQGFAPRHISHLLDIVCENQGQTGFSVAEVGAGTGGFTRQVSPARA